MPYPPSPTLGRSTLEAPVGSRASQRMDGTTHVSVLDENIAPEPFQPADNRQRLTFDERFPSYAVPGGNSSLSYAGGRPQALGLPPHHVDSLMMRFKVHREDREVVHTFNEVSQHIHDEYSDLLDILASQ